MRTHLVGSLVLLSLVIALRAWAGSDEAKRAYERGDYITALRELLSFTNTLDEKCKKFSQQFVEEFRIKHPELYKEDYNMFIHIDSFYSRTLDTCIQTEVSEVGVRYIILDLNRSLLRDGGKALLYCDPSGADSVIIEKVKEHRGYVSDVRYKEYLDNGFGGLPRAEESPKEPYTKAQCQKVFDKWLSILKK